MGNKKRAINIHIDQFIGEVKIYSAHDTADFSKKFRKEYQKVTEESNQANFETLVNHLQKGFDRLRRAAEACDSHDSIQSSEHKQPSVPQ